MTAIEIFKAVGSEAMARANGGRVTVFLGAEKHRVTGELWLEYVEICAASGVANGYRPGICVGGPYLLRSAADKQACGKFIHRLEKRKIPFRVVRGKISKGAGADKLEAAWIWRTDGGVSLRNQSARVSHREMVQTVAPVRALKKDGRRSERDLRETQRRLCLARKKAKAGRKLAAVTEGGDS